MSSKGCHIAVPLGDLQLAIDGLREGAAALMDRDWDYYEAGDRAEIATHVREALLLPAERLERLLPGD